MTTYSLIKPRQIATDVDFGSGDNAAKWLYVDNEDADRKERLALSALDARYQTIDAELTAIAGLVSAADKLPYFTGSGAASLADLTAFARTILDDANAAGVRTTLELGTLATINDAPSDGTIYGRQDGGWVEAGGGGSSLPVVDETAIVYKTGSEAITATFDANSLTTARTYTLPDVSSTVAVLGTAQTFSAAQTIDGSTDAVQLTIQAHSSQTAPVFQCGVWVSPNAGAEFYRVVEGVPGVGSLQLR